jgi:hypothetical protein
LVSGNIFKRKKKEIKLTKAQRKKTPEGTLRSLSERSKRMGAK